MPKSRYQNTQIIDGKYYATWRLPVQALGYKDLDLLQGVRTFDYVYQAGDRLDHLSARYYSDEGYWWVISISNGIIYPFSSGGLVPNRTLKIAYDVNDILDKILK